MYLALADPCDHCVNETKLRDKGSSLRINFVLETRDQTQPGSLSLSVASPGRVGENPGDKVGQEHFWIMKGFPISLRWRIIKLKQNGQWLNEIAETLFLYYMYTKVFR